MRLCEPIDADALAQRLYERKLVRYPRLLAWWLQRRGKTQIAAGDYEFSQNQSLFYVAQADNPHPFSSTYEEHLRAIREIRQARE